MTFRGDPVIMDLHGVPMAAFADSLDTVAERIGIVDGPVLDHTGLNGRYDIHLEFANDSSAGDTPAKGESLFTALRDQTGLKLERTIGPREFIVIDHIEKASEN